MKAVWGTACVSAVLTFTGEARGGREREVQTQTYEGSGIHWRIRKEKGSADPRDRVTWGGLGRLGTLPRSCWP